MSEASRAISESSVHDASGDRFEGERPCLLFIAGTGPGAAALQSSLTRAGFSIDCVFDWKEAKSLLSDRSYPLVVLELHHHAQDALSVARKIRESWHVPIAVFSDRSDELDRVLLLETVADDFIDTSASAREITARVRAIVRRCSTCFGVSPEDARRNPVASIAAKPFKFGDWTLCVSRRVLLDGLGRSCKLTFAEFELLAFLVRSPGEVHSRDALLRQVNFCGRSEASRSIDVLVMRVRRKIEPDPKQPIYLLTSRAVGYVFIAEGTAPQR